MILLSRDLLRLLQKCINCAYFFRSIPFKWSENEAEVQVYFPKSRPWNFYRWEVLAIVHLVHQMFIYSRLFQLILEAGFLHGSQTVMKYNHTVVTLAVLYTLGYSVISAVQVVLIHYKWPVFEIINQMLVYFKKFEGKLFSTKNSTRKIIIRNLN